MRKKYARMMQNSGFIALLLGIGGIGGAIEIDGTAQAWFLSCALLIVGAALLVIGLSKEEGTNHVKRNTRRNGRRPVYLPER